MKERIIWLYYYFVCYFNYTLRYFCNKMNIKYNYNPRFKGKNIMSLNETQKKIKDIIVEGKPALIARFGGNEARCTVEYIGIKLGVRKHFSKKSLKYMHMNAGVFPEGNSMLERFGAISEHAAKQVDILAWWPSILQEYLIDNTLKKDTLLTSLEDLEPYY